MAQVGPIGHNLGFSEPKLGQAGPKRSDVQKSWPQDGPFGPKLGQAGPKRSDVQGSWLQVGPKEAKGSKREPSEGPKTQQTSKHTLRI